MADRPALDRLLRHDRLIVIAGLAILCALAWTYVITGAGTGMEAQDMTRLALLPPPDAHTAMAAPAWSLRTGATMAAMWWLMMIAMMAPAAAPTILLYAEVHRREAEHGRIDRRLAPTGAFAAGYLLVWLGVSIGAAALHEMLEGEGLVSQMTMGSRSRWFSGGLLIAAGLYQLSPLKGACLSQCRSPAAFLSRHWRRGRATPMRLGLLHGAYCVGCCWLLMALLFVGGVMNLVWIAALTVMVTIEKLLPLGRWIGRAAGLALIAWGAALLPG